MPRYLRQHLVARKRDVVKVPNDLIGRCGTQLLRGQHELIVMNPDGCIRIGLGLAGQFIGESLVDLPVGGEPYGIGVVSPLCLVQLRDTIDQAVHHRPQQAVAEAFEVVLVLLGRQR
jgi:hypothetical protein